MLDSTRVEGIPLNGVYLNYEKGENYSADDELLQRIVHVGRNRESQNLRERLKSHYVFRGRRSIFRNHVGTALLTRDGRLKLLQNLPFKPSETRKVTPLARAAFPRFEDAITEYMVTSFTFRYIEVEDRSYRKELEERLIYTLALCQGCVPSQNWLGKYALNAGVKSGHLWNDQHTKKGKSVRPEDLDYLTSFAGH